MKSNAKSATHQETPVMGEEPEVSDVVCTCGGTTVLFCFVKHVPVSEMTYETCIYYLLFYFIYFFTTCKSEIVLTVLEVEGLVYCLLVTQPLGTGIHVLV